MNIKLKKAVAIHYRAELSAPIIVAKGKCLMADKIIETAINKNIPIVKNSELTSLLYKVDVGNYIPSELYKAVAEVLIFINKLEEEV